MQIVLILSNTLLFILSAIVLVKSSIRIIEKLYILAKIARIPTFIVGFFFLAVATSIPELLIGITSAIQLTPEISLGNIIGSNISNMTLIIGLAILIAGHITTGKKYKKETLIAITISSFVIALSFDGLISQTDGFILLITFILYAYRLLRIRNYKEHEIVKIKFNRRKVSTDIGTVVILIILMLISSEGIVSSTTIIAKAINISPLIISLFIIAIGTSLPELASMIPAIKKEHTGISLGNILGSIVTNSTLVIGITAILAPIKITNRTEFQFTSLFTIFTFLVFYMLIRKESNLTKKEAIILIFIYITFLFTQIFLESIFKLP